MNNQFGSDPNTLYRKQDPNTSEQSAYSVDTTKLEKLVFDAIKSFGSKGCISDEVRAKFPDLSYSSVTARYKALGDKGFIVFDGTKKGNSNRQQRIMKAKSIEDKNDTRSVA